MAASEQDGTLVLVGPGGDLDFAEGDGEGLERALSGEPFRLEDLAAPDPGALVRRLWTAGYLERV